MRCSKNGCQEVPVFECICGSQKNHFCDAHFTEHTISDFQTHINRRLPPPINPEVKHLVLSSLESFLEKLLKSKYQLIEDFSKKILSFKEKFRVALLQIDENSKKLKKFIREISNESGLPDCQIRSTLQKSEDEVKLEVLTWEELFEFSLENDGLMENIEKYIRLKTSFETLFKLKETSRVLEKYPPPLSSNFIVLKPESLKISSQGQEKILSTPKPKCLKGHEMTWSTLVPNNYLKIFKNFNIFCNICKFRFSSSCWNCLSCTYDLCEKCGIKKGFQAPKLKCSNDHELLWRPETCSYYESLERTFSFSCKICEKSKNEPCWSCRFCYFDVCIECAESRFNYIYLKSAVLCPEGHFVDEKTLSDEENQEKVKISCSLCENHLKGQGVICGKCQWKSCLTCKKTIEKPFAGHPVLSCRKGHLMVWDSPGNFVCCCCFQVFESSKFRCYECKVFICLKCSDVLIEFVTSNKKIMHEEGHFLNWICDPFELTGRNLKCALCDARVCMTGMFYCYDCQNGFCVPCFSDYFREF